MGPRVLFYVQHLLGIGHFRRSALLARALAGAGLDVEFVSGGEKVEGVDLGKARLRQLPPARSKDKDFSAILDENGREIDEAWRADRCAMLLSLYRSLRPDIVLIEMFPFGRQQFRFELVPLLEAARSDPGQPIVACSVRDILVDKKRPERQARIVEMLRRYFSLILVHADPAIVTLDRTFPLAKQIADLITYTGYVVDAAEVSGSSADRAQGDVLVSAGGGAVGLKLLMTAIDAKAHSRYGDRTWRIITGANLGETGEATIHKRAANHSGVVVETFRPDFRQLLEHCLVSVSQAGYNTLLELIAAKVPSVVVPFSSATESEQTLRASLFAERGMLEMLSEADLTPVLLARAIDRAGTPRHHEVDLGGAARTAQILIERLRRSKLR